MDCSDSRKRASFLDYCVPETSVNVPSVPAFPPKRWQRPVKRWNESYGTETPSPFITGGNLSIHVTFPSNGSSITW